MALNMIRARGRRRPAFLLAAVAIALLCDGPARAQPYPSQPTTIVVPYSAGGVVDVIARIVADQLRTALGQPVIVENKSGAGGNVGTASVANAAPNGYTLLLASPSHTINPSLYPKLSWDPVQSFKPVGMIGIVPNVLVVHPSVAANTLEDFITLARSRRGELTYATPGPGTSNHLAAEFLKDRAGIDMVHVPYRGQPDALRDLLAGRVQFMAITLALVQQPIASGQLKALAVGSNERSSLLPDVPTAREAGLDDFESVAWFALFAPARTSPDVVRRLNADLRAILAKPEVIDRLRLIGLETRAGGPEDLAAFVAKDRERWAETIRKANIRIE